MYVFNVWRKWSCGVVCVWPRTNADTIGSMFIWFCYLEWIINGGKSIWCDLLTSKICQVKGTVLVLVRIFINKIKTYRPKKMIIRTMWEAVNSDIYFYYVGKLCTDITPTNSRAKWEDDMLSHTRRKNSLDSQSEFCTHSVVYILCLVYILYSVCSLHFVLTGIRYSLFLVKVIRTTHAIYHKIPVSQFDIFVLFRVNTLLSFCKNLEITYNVSSNPLTPQKITRACMVCLCLN